MSPKSKLFLPLIIAISIVAGMLLSLALFRNQTKEVLGFKLPRKDKLSTIIDYVKSEYVDEVNVDSLVELAIPNFLKQLDPHSVYMSADEAKAVNEPLEGNFEGIGIQFSVNNDTILIVDIIHGGPSEKIGLKAGDKIITVNDSLVAGVGIRSDNVVKLLKGQRGTTVKVGIMRKGRDKLLHFNIIRDKIPILSIDAAYMINEKSGYIKISSFSKTTHSEFVEAAFKLNQAGMKNLILDLRGNSGGYLDAATNIVDEFLKGGKLIVYTEGHARPKNAIYSTDKRAVCVNVKLVVLIDEFSASASEIVAGAIQDNDRGWVIGRRSFGKGLVQEPTVFKDGSMLRLTTARYYTPSGRCIQKNYTGGYESYYDELMERYLHGEFQDADSIELIDSLQFKTTGGRLVYGGGGIMPDIFVPIDSVLFNPTLRLISDYGLSYTFALQYSDKNREIFSKISTPDSLIMLLNKKLALTEFSSYIQKNKHHISYFNWNNNMRYIKNQVYGYILRNVFDDNAFYRYINELDNTYIQALNILESNKQLTESQNKQSGK